MPYVIDGHNLIGAFPGLELSDPDDERKLIDALERFGRATRRRAIVFFDRGRPESGRGALRGRMVEAHFSVPPRSADEALLAFLRAHRDARNYTVVTSDAEVRRAARRAGAAVVSAQQFSRELQDGLDTRRREKPAEEPDDVEEWLKLFGDPD
jgi:predicted RNA-binding protein with PIN domain